MEFGLAEEQTLLQDSVARFLTEQYPLDKVREYAAGDDDGSAVRQGLNALGIPALMIPEEHGGVGLGLLEAALIAEALGNGVAPAPYVAGVVMLPTALAANPELAEAWLPKIAAGEVSAGAAVSELTGARGDAGVNASGDRLNGKSMFVIDFDADLYLVGARDAGAPALYLVEADAQGLTAKAYPTVDATRKTGELHFNDTPATPVGCTAAQITAVLDYGRVILAADSLGAAQNMLDQAVDYAKQREQFNRVIASFQAVKHMCAEMAASLEPCRAMVWYAAHAADAGLDEARQYACHTKAHVSEVAQFVARTATEVHGGMGFTDLVGLHYWFKRIGANRQLLGSPERLRDEAARDANLMA
ncbi:MAG: acyl-CoA dehydrogenase family protein [Pseudomonadota bacterium]